LQNQQSIIVVNSLAKALEFAPKPSSEMRLQLQSVPG